MSDLVVWFEDRIRELRRGRGSERLRGDDAPEGEAGARLLELEALRDEARRIAAERDAAREECERLRAALHECRSALEDIHDDYVEADRIADAALAQTEEAD